MNRKDKKVVLLSIPDLLLNLRIKSKPLLFDQRELLIGPNVSLSLPVSGFNSNVIGLEVHMHDKSSAIWENYPQGKKTVPGHSSQ